jgi:hypothetical protein
MQFTLKNNTIKIDNGDHYYTGEISSEMFPEEIRDNYEQIINQSFENYSDDKYSVSIVNNFDIKDPSFTINFQYNVKPFTFKRNILIPVVYHLKDFQDYTNERIEKLDNEVATLRSLVESLLNKNIIDDEQEEEDSDLEDNDSTLSEEEIVEVPVKGGKRVPVVVQMKGLDPEGSVRPLGRGRQVAAKK